MCNEKHKSKSFKWPLGLSLKPNAEKRTFLLTVALIGGPASNEGYLYATNPATGIYGPVCDDFFTSVSELGKGF